MAFVLALDQGTTSSRAVVLDREGAPVAAAQREFPQHYPKPGWVEHDPLDIWTSQRDVAEEALGEAGLTGGDVAAIGITNQRETAVVWNRETGEPVHRAIVWQDRRTAPMIDRLNEQGAAPMIRRKTGLVPDPYFSASKVTWILDNVAGARRDAEAGRLAFGTVDSWIVYKLTEGRLHLTDVSNASRTMLYDIREARWDDELLELFGVPRSMLPQVRASSEVYGESSVAGGAPIAGIAGDQQAALAGQACFDPGMSKLTYGTGCFLLLNTGPEVVDSSNRLLSTVAWRIGDLLHHALEGSVFIGGAVVQWLRDGLGIIESAAEVEALAASVEDNGGVFLVPAFAGLGAPHWDPYARGAVFGLTRGSTAGHLARAALESIAFQCADLFDAMAADFPADRSELRVDGGASANDLLLQLQADLLGVPIVRPRIKETTVQGAAYLAGLAAGVWKDLDEVRRHWHPDRRFEPRMPPEQAAALRARWNEAVKRASGWERAES